MSVILCIRCCFSIRNISYHEPATYDSFSTSQTALLVQGHVLFLTKHRYPLVGLAIPVGDIPTITHTDDILTALKKVREVLSQPCVVKSTLYHNNDIHIHSFELYPPPFLPETYSSPPPFTMHSLLILIIPFKK